MSAQVLYEDSEHKFIWLKWDQEEEGELVQTNQFLIINRGKGVLLDPGSVYVLPEVIASVSEHIDLDRIEYIFYTHQDPDVSSGIPVWLENTNAKVYISKLWTRFLPHFGLMDTSRIVGIEDKGGEITLGTGDKLLLIPAHFLHSTGNFTLFDTRSRILFSGDIGASVFPKGESYSFVEDFDRHLPYTEGFHRRYMASKRACRIWVNMVRKHNPQMIAPQHGALFKGESVNRFLDWLSDLDCGVDILEKIVE